MSALESGERVVMVQSGKWWAHRSAIMRKTQLLLLRSVAMFIFIVPRYLLRFFTFTLGAFAFFDGFFYHPVNFREVFVPFIEVIALFGTHSFACHNLIPL
tara:strand:- start:4936 stop:5235 length:300 start_codon:yes stop_codon:yes gene_type:complete